MNGSILIGGENPIAPRQVPSYQRPSSSPLGQNPSSDQATSIIELILSQKEQELEQINQLKIKNIQNMIESKLKIIENLEKQNHQEAHIAQHLP